MYGYKYITTPEALSPFISWFKAIDMPATDVACAHYFYYIQLQL